VLGPDLADNHLDHQIGGGQAVVEVGLQVAVAEIGAAERLVVAAEDPRQVPEDPFGVESAAAQGDIEVGQHAVVDLEAFERLNLAGGARGCQGPGRKGHAEALAGGLAEERALKFGREQVPPEVDAVGMKALGVDGLGALPVETEIHRGEGVFAC